MGSSKDHLQSLALEIFAARVRNDIKLIPCWLPREDNEFADALSKFKDTGDWGLDYNCQTTSNTGPKIISLRKLECIQASQDLVFMSCLHGKSMQTRPGFRHSIKSRENHLSFAVVQRENSHHFLDRLMKQGCGEH